MKGVVAGVRIHQMFSFVRLSSTFWFYIQNHLTLHVSIWPSSNVFWYMTSVFQGEELKNWVKGDICFLKNVVIFSTLAFCERRWVLASNREQFCLGSWALSCITTAVWTHAHAHVCYAQLTTHLLPRFTAEVTIKPSGSCVVKGRLSDWLLLPSSLYVSRPVAGQLPRLRQSRTAAVIRRNVPWAPWARRPTTQVAPTTAPFLAAPPPRPLQPPPPVHHPHGSVSRQT